jgi:membrane fusion protein (multidrug efflux system)
MPSPRPTIIAGAVAIAAFLGLAWYVSVQKATTGPGPGGGPPAGAAAGGGQRPQGGPPGGGAPNGGARPQGAAGAGPGNGGGRPGGGFGGPQEVAVVTATIKSTSFADAVEALGTAKANESVNITAKTANRIVAFRFTEGQQVRKGDVLVELDAVEAAADLAVAQAALADTQSQYKRSTELFATKALSQAQMDQIQSTLRQNEARVSAAQGRMNETEVRAPFSGRVGLRNVSVGSYVTPATVITTLDDTSIIKLDFSVPETSLTMLANGLSIQATSTAYPGVQFNGKVASIDSRIDPVSRSVLVRGNIDNRDGRLKPGMFMTVRLLRSEDMALTLPEQALVPEADRQYVFVVADGKVAKTEITLGRRRPGEVEVLKGLKEGDVVVTEGTQKLVDGTKVRLPGEAPRAAGQGRAPGQGQAPAGQRRRPEAAS